MFWAAIALCLVLGLSIIWTNGAEDEEDDEELDAPIEVPTTVTPRPVALAASASHASYVAALGALAEDLDADYAAVYAAQWRSMLPNRIARVVASVTVRDDEAAMDAILSLKVSSSSVGATDLAESAEVIEAALRDGDWELADGLTASLDRLAVTAAADLDTWRATA